MLMRTPARERPRFGERRRTIDRLRDFFASLASSAAARRPTYEIVQEEPDDNNMDVALAALIDSIERPAKPAAPRVPSLGRVTASRQAPHIPVYERPPHFDAEPRLIAAPEAASERTDARERTEAEDEVSQLRKDLMKAISARLGSPDDHLATIRSLLRSVR